MSAEVVYLDFKKAETTEPDVMCYIACKFCHNKTFTLVEDLPDYFNMMRCAACGAHLGRIGWAQE